jgi:hypothetical protein
LAKDFSRLKMFGKQHTTPAYKLFLALLFLLFNAVCVAAPAIKFAAQESIAISLPSAPRTTETGEENQVTLGSYVNQQHFSHRSQSVTRISNSISSLSAVSDNLAVIHKSYITAAALFPTPGYYCFLFRYNLF